MTSHSSPSTPPTPTTRLPKASDLVVGWLRENILSGQWPAGTKLPPETELMTMFGVGRVSVREAVRLVDRDGLVETRRGATGGIFVRRPAPSELSESFSIMLAAESCTVGEALQFRLMLEPEAAAAAARQIESAGSDLRSRLNEEACADGLDLLHGLHITIAEMSGNRVLYIVLAALGRVMSESLRAGKVSSTDVAGTIAAHRKIAKKIEDGDPDGAHHAMRQHLEAYVEYAESQDLASSPVIPPNAWKDLRP